MSKRACGVIGMFLFFPPKAVKLLGGWKIPGRTPDRGPGRCIRVGDDRQAIPGEGAFERLVTRLGYPAIHDKGQRAACRDPLAVVFPGDVQMSPAGRTALTGGMPDWVTSAQVSSHWDPIAAFDMHVKDRPAGLLETIPVQVLDDCAVLRTHDQAICGCGDPGVRKHTAAFRAGWGEIEGRQGALRFPGFVWPTSITPNLPGQEG